MRPADAFGYEAKLKGVSLRLAEKRGAEVCFELPPSATGVVIAVGVTMTDGMAKGPLVVWLYDRGAAGFRLVAGLERRFH